MAAKEEALAHRFEDPEMRFVTLKMSQLACDALGSGEAERTEARVELAIRFYLQDRVAAQAAWPYPSFLRGSEVREDVELRLGIERELWREFELAAAHQGVSVQQLAEHAVFYFAAELDAGRVAERIVEALEADEAGD